MMTPEQQLDAWRKLGDAVRIENEQLQTLAVEMGLPKPQDKQGYEGEHTAFSIIVALRDRLGLIYRCANWNLKVVDETPADAIAPAREEMLCGALLAIREWAAIGNTCHTQSVSSRTCERGTHGCNVQHGESK
jgi:hypothetical protein